MSSLSSLVSSLAAALLCLSVFPSASTSASVSELYLSTPRTALPLNLFPLILSHDSASGELDESRDHIVAAWARTQSASLVGQLDCGARAFDYRPKLEKDRQIYAHHGGITIRVPMAQSVKEIMAWSNAHPEDLVVLYVSHFDGEGCEDEVAKLLKSLRVKMIRHSETASCQSQLQGLTYGKAKSMSSIEGGGSLLAVFDCTEENYDSTINCYGKDFTCYDSWPENTASTPFEHFHSYITNTTSYDPTKSSANLWMNQGHWQATAATITLGTLHRSSLVEDEQRSAVNLWVKQLIEDQEMKYLNLLELEDVCDHGVDVYNAIQQVYLSGKV